MKDMRGIIHHTLTRWINAVEYMIKNIPENKFEERRNQLYREATTMLRHIQSLFPRWSDYEHNK